MSPALGTAALALVPLLALAAAPRLDALAGVMLALVTFIALVIDRYSRRYLDGQPAAAPYRRWFLATIAATSLLVTAGDLRVLALAWTASSLSLHQLLTFFADRPQAQVAAHKKFLLSRLADVAIYSAVFLTGRAFGTWDIAAVLQAATASGGDLPGSVHAAGYLLVAGVALRSAQLPFHGWLIQVMEAPTPVSALLHAGVVNIGGYVLIRLAGLMGLLPGAQLALVVIGAITAVLAALVMTTRVSVKVALAWSTAAQMGFMLLECGLGLYSLALLHIVAHSLYKAHAFLASGSGVDAFRAPLVTAARSKSESLDLARLVPALAAGFGLTLAAAWLTGVRWDIEPALVAAVVIVAVATSQLIGEVTATLGRARWLWAGALSTAVLGAYFALHALFDRLLAASVTPPPPAATQGHDVLVPLVVATFIALIVMQRLMRRTGSPLMQRVYVHLYNGLYIDVFITRFLQRVWPARARMTP